ncbi:MFS transporter [Kribbella shirazensis]|uniref:DHA2 family methylenomycin A resistance protein-like MFS transporter n=1 Tax=Kribbella shirazensis TaxID=1105143 RepID=A0A7X5V496_9ACTN|nr:MFS transporter [Kribbella shirazensis]NIK54297.1 DHA2 family methylenomycin A resistance protein-like MFS transporter [Kribbella shirazensis]
MIARTDSFSASVLAVGAAALSFFLITLNASMVTTALPVIGRELGGGSALAWVLTGYSLALAACLLPAGVLSDRIGARRAFITGMLVFAGTSVVCAIAGTLTMLLAARAVQGAAAAAVLPAGLALLTAAVPDPERRSSAIGRWSAAGAVALVVGSPAGGALTTAFGWRATFWANAVVGLVTLLAAFAAPNHHSRPQPEHSGPPVDRRAAGISAVTGFAVNFSSYGAIFVLTLFLQDHLGHSPWTTGLVFVPMTLLIIPANLLAGPLTNRYGVIRVLVAGQMLMLIGLAGLCTTPEAVSALIAWLLPIGIGAGLAAPAMTTMMLTGVPGPRAGFGAGVLNAARQVGSGAAAGLFGALLSSGALSGVRTSLVIACAAVLVSALLATIG